MKKSSFYDTPLHSTPPLGGFPSEYRHPFGMEKTGMVVLPDGEKKIGDICNGLDTIPACDRQTNRQTDILPRHIRAMHTRRAVKSGPVKSIKTN